MRPFVKLVWPLVVLTIGLIICVYLPGILGTQKRMEKAWLVARSRVQRGRVWEGLGPSQKRGIFRSEWRVLVNFQQYFWAIACKTVRRMYRSVVLPVSITPVYPGQTVGWIRMPRGVEVGLDPGDIVLDGDPALPTEKRHSSPRPTFTVYVQRP